MLPVLTFLSDLAGIFGGAVYTSIEIGLAYDAYFIQSLEILTSSDIMQGLEKSVHFHNRVPVDQVPNLIRNAHLGLVPCKKDVFVDKVMLPVRLLEYVVMGLPAVVSRVGTVETYFNDDEVAYYPHNNATSLANQIVNLYHNPERRSRMAQRARIAFQGYEWPNMQTRYYRVLDKLIQS